MSIGRWSEPSVVLVCQLEEVMREADANETSGEEDEALHGNWGVPVEDTKVCVANCVLQMIASRIVGT